MALSQSDSYVSEFVKYTLFAFNLFIWVVSGTIVGVGLWAFNEKNKFHTGSSSFDIYNIIFDFTIFMIILGLVVFMVAFMGCIGALRENVLLLKIFSYTLGVLFLFQVILAALAFIFSTQLEAKVTDLLKHEGIQRYRNDLDLQNFFDWVQKTFQCCGVDYNSYENWNQNMYYNCSEHNKSPERCSVPYSCCKKMDEFENNLINLMCGYEKQKLSFTAASGSIYTTGCVKRVLDVAKSNMFIIGGVVLGLSIPQLLGIFLSRILSNQIEDQRDRYL